MCIFLKNSTIKLNNKRPFKITLIILRDVHSAEDLGMNNIFRDQIVKSYFTFRVYNTKHKLSENSDTIEADSNFLEILKFNPLKELALSPKFIFAIIECIQTLLKYNSDTVLSTGGCPAILIMIIDRLNLKKMIYVDSITGITCRSLTVFLVYHFPADQFLIQLLGHNFLYSKAIHRWRGTVMVFVTVGTISFFNFFLDGTPNYEC